MSCVITDGNDIVKSVSLIPGLGRIPQGWHCYFPTAQPWPKEGEVFKAEIGKDSCFHKVEDSAEKPG